LRVDREAPIPPSALIVAANHASHLDPPFVGVAVDRPLRFMAVDGLWDEHRWLGLVLNLSGSIPLARERAPLGAMRSAASHLRAGGSVGIFPEGGVTPRWGSAEPHPSAAWLSLRTGVPILPVAVIGSGEVYEEDASRLKRSRVLVTIGSPIDPVDFQEMEDPSAAMMSAWANWIGGILGTGAGG
jgi:1-acyl-sn-glycerol-3-phosphate acyltransferase